MGPVLYVVATPIGNLEDITYRAVRILREADLVACEDTRQTRKLLDRYDIHTPTISYHEHNEASRSAQLLEKLRGGAVVALVSDAGTPLISDPGYRLVSKAVEQEIPVQSIPGPSAFLTALTASGLPTDSVHFGGFLPAKSTQRRKLLGKMSAEPSTCVFFEAPHRILRTLEDIESVLGKRPVVVAREMTKIHEEFLRGTAASLRQLLQERGSLKGEITLVIGKATEQPAEDTPLDEAVQARIQAGMTRMEAIKDVARSHGRRKGDVYRAVEQTKPKTRRPS